GAKPLDVVQRARITEVLDEVGVLDFGHGLTAKATVALWRTGVVGPSLVGELAYQCKFERDEDVHMKARKRADALYARLQDAARDWLALGVTKTRGVYGLGKTAPRHPEGIAGRSPPRVARLDLLDLSRDRCDQLRRRHGRLSARDAGLAASLARRRRLHHRARDRPDPAGSQLDEHQHHRRRLAARCPRRG